jgi:hypothetical protein
MSKSCGASPGSRIPSGEMSSRPSCRRQAGFVSLLAAVLVAAGSGAAYVAPLASAQRGVLVRFVEAGPGPRQTVLEVDVGGSSTETTDLVPSTHHRSRSFELDRPMLDTLESRVLAADFPQLDVRYGLPNPGGVFTVTTTGTRTTTVYPPASGPAGLRRLNLYLEQIVTKH